MDKTLLAKTLVNLGSKVTQAYQELQAPKLMRKVCAELHIKQINESEESLEKALIPFFVEQVKSVQKQIRQKQEALIESLFNPKDWDLELLQRLADPLIKVMAEGIASQMVLMNVDPQKYTRHWQKASLPDPDYNLETSYGTVNIGILTEYPQWMRDKIKEMLEESFSQDYWAQVNLTTKADIDNFLVKGLQEGWSLNELAYEIAPQLLEEGKYAFKRAQLIARTESTNALNGAKVAAIDAIMEDPRIIMKKVWFSALKDTTRATHANLDGVPADKDGRWLLSGYRARWPGDINLPAEERCNCFCSVISEFGMTDDQAEQLLVDYYGRSERSTWSVLKGGAGSGNWGHAGRPLKIGGSGKGGSHPADPVKDINGKYIPGKVGVLADVDTSKWGKDSSGAQLAMKKIAFMEELAAKGDWAELSKYVTAPPKPNTYQKITLKAQENLLKLKDKDVSKPIPNSTPTKTDPAVSTDLGWKQIGGKLGTEKGGTYIGPDGKKYYVKQPDNAARAHNEVLACKLYEAAGANVVKADLLEIEGKKSVATEWLESAKLTWNPTDKKQAAEDFAIHAWLNNRDAVGAGTENPMDNIRLDKTNGKLKLVDAGGSLDYAGMGGGGKKPFDSKADEWDTLRDSKINPTMGQVFGGMTSEQLIQSAKKLESISDKTVVELVNKYHGGSSPEKAAMVSTLINRKNDILGRAKKLEEATKVGTKVDSKTPVTVPPPPIFPDSFAMLKSKASEIYEAAKKGDIKAVENIEPPNTTGTIATYKNQVLAALKSGGKTNEDHTVPPKPKPIVVDEKKFPAPPTFVGSHKADNEVVIKALVDVAKTGDLDALKATSIPPSPKLKEFHNQLISNLAKQLNPPPPPKTLDASYLDAAKKLGNAKTKAGLAKIGKWDLIGDLGGVPEVTKGAWNSAGDKDEWEEGHKIWDSMSIGKNETKKYTGGSYTAYNNALRAGDFNSASGKNALKVSKGLMKHGKELEVGSRLSRTHSELTKAETDSLKPGTVVSDRGILSTSTKEEGVFFSNKVHWHLTVGPGVKGLHVDYFSENPGEREVLLPPNQKLLITKVEHDVTKKYSSAYSTSSSRDHTLPDKKTIVWAVILPTEDNQCCPP